jgi:hypothetical protein
VQLWERIRAFDAHETRLRTLERVVWTMASNLTKLTDALAQLGQGLDTLDREVQALKANPDVPDSAVAGVQAALDHVTSLGASLAPVPAPQPAPAPITATGGGPFPATDPTTGLPSTQAANLQPGEAPITPGTQP